jgi:MscS family membrane protein
MDLNSIDTGMTEASVWWAAFNDHLVSIGIILGVALVINIIQAFILRNWARRMNRGGFQWTAGIASSLTAPLGWAIWFVAISIIAQYMVQPDTAKWVEDTQVHRIGQVRLGLVLLLGAWFVVRSIRYFESLLSAIAREKDGVDLTIVKALSNFFVIFTWLLFLLIGLQSYGVNMTAIITIGGAGGFALTFAFQDVFKNLFGGVMILFSRPFKLGDDVEVSSILGTVEKIGLYQTIVRGWDSVPFVLPNSMFLTNPVKNIGKRSQRRIKFDIGLRYEDFSRVEGVVDDITEFLNSHDLVDHEKFLRVYFSLYGDSSLNISIACFGLADLGEVMWFELEQSILLGVGDIVSGHGADFAFPTTTLDLPDATSPPARRTRGRRKTIRKKASKKKTTLKKASKKKTTRKKASKKKATRKKASKKKATRKTTARKKTSRKKTSRRKS